MIFDLSDLGVLADLGLEHPPSPDLMEMDFSANFSSEKKSIKFLIQSCAFKVESIHPFPLEQVGSKSLPKVSSKAVRPDEVGNVKQSTTHTLTRKERRQKRYRRFVEEKRHWKKTWCTRKQLSKK